MSESIETVKGNKKVMNAWAFYDWANSVYPLVITTAIFPLFYQAKMPEIVEFLGGHFSRVGIYSYTIAISLLLVAMLSPILSGIADYVGNKKFFMKTFNYIGVASCFSMYFFESLPVFFQFFIILTANLGFWGSLVFYNSYLPEVAERKDHDNLSAKGFSLGYVGSVVLLGITLAMVMSQEEPEQKVQMMRYAFLLTGIWWFGFAQISYRFLPNTYKGEKFTKHILSSGYKELRSVWREFMTIKSLKRFLRAFFIYSMAVQTIMTMAQFFGTDAVDWSRGMDINNVIDKDFTLVWNNSIQNILLLSHDFKSSEWSSFYIDFSHFRTSLSPDDLTTITNKHPIVSGKMQVSMIISIILIQLIAIPGAYLFSYMSGIYGNIKVLISAVVIWVIICGGAYFVDSPFEFYTTAFFIGLVMGGVQSLSRSTYSKMLPDTTDTTSYFSFYDVLEKIGMTIGIISFGFLEDAFNIRYSVMALMIFFIVGLVLLLFVPRKKVA